VLRGHEKLREKTGFGCVRDRKCLKRDVDRVLHQSQVDLRRSQKELPRAKKTYLQPKSAVEISVMELKEPYKSKALAELREEDSRKAQSLEQFRDWISKQDHITNPRGGKSVTVAVKSDEIAHESYFQMIIICFNSFAPKSS
jgi:hypothetical protein